MYLALGSNCVKIYFLTGGQRRSASFVRPGSEFHESCLSSAEGVHGFAGADNFSTFCSITCCIIHRIICPRHHHYCYRHRR